ncbi:single-stranded DNA-binding protein [Lysinibacillus sp. KCTC 33748]|uniref:single-stranded DNA-binding protein n=1 Tax=unclassified Lysinibacillus TaxID=2636778 RepID=UPI0009A5FFAD|nr:MULTISPECIES: single-stranded DNA-binding protein [unclassified Lysinibacillus]OXS74895.1 single-stranded DNA-binding protein [Lysinibacillus sp. KCTC 33748]SKB59407.1 single-strand binding protein [Lysinibacillus sp. AC-3]
MINRVVLVGRLTKDPELRYTPNEVATCRFTVAVNRTFKGQNGEPEADFISCVAWRKQAENLANFMKKASLIGLEGRIQTGSYEGQDGKCVYTTDVVADSIQFLEPKNGTGGSRGVSNYESSTNTGGANQNAPQGNNGGNNNQPSYLKVEDDPFANSKGPMQVSEDDLPF